MFRHAIVVVRCEAVFGSSRAPRALARGIAGLQAERVHLPPTSDELTRAEARRYFLWWTVCTVAQMREHLSHRC